MKTKNYWRQAGRRKLKTTKIDQEMQASRKSKSVKKNNKIRKQKR